MVDYSVLVYILLPVVAFLYASVGHGGASGYLMVMALFNFTPTSMRPSALILNIVVSLLAWFEFKKTADFPTRLFISLIVFSVPAALLGGSIRIDAGAYKFILALILLLASYRIVFPSKNVGKVRIAYRFGIAAVAGVCIGFLSGLIGIGGGIILSPFLLLVGWADFRQAAAVSALFIFFNSIAGLLGFAATHHLAAALPVHFWFLIGGVIVGGYAGARLGARYFPPLVLRWLLAAVLVVAALKLMMT